MDIKNLTYILENKIGLNLNNFILTEDQAYINMKGNNVLLKFNKNYDYIKCRAHFQFFGIEKTFLLFEEDLCNGIDLKRLTSNYNDLGLLDNIDFTSGLPDTQLLNILKLNRAGIYFSSNKIYLYLDNNGNIDLLDNNLNDIIDKIKQSFLLLNHYII